MNYGAVIVAAGRGERLGLGVPKALAEIESVSLVAMSAWALAQAPELKTIVVVAPRGFVEETKNSIERWRIPKIAEFVPGGEFRQDSVRAGLDALPAEIDAVLIHDGARCLVNVDLVERVMSAMRIHDAVLPALPITDTLHTNEDGYAQPAPERSTLVRAQTPQGFIRRVLEEALRIGGDGWQRSTDETALVRETVKEAAFLVEGDETNVKITSPVDLLIYMDLLKMRSSHIKEDA